jgi:hypothetical protein
MTEQDVEVILQKTGETYPAESPRIISDNGPQFIALKKTSKSSSASWERCMSLCGATGSPLIERRIFGTPPPWGGFLDAGRRVAQVACQPGGEAQEVFFRNRWPLNPIYIYSTPPNGTSTFAGRRGGWGQIVGGDAEWK